MTIRRLVDEHDCRGDDGRDYRVLEYQDFSTSRSGQGAGELPGRKWLQLDSGGMLNFISDGVFVIVATDVVVRK